MPPSLYSFATALHRFVAWPTGPPKPELPNELIFEEILPYLYEEHPSSFYGLQVAFTCKAFYQRFQPMIASFCIDRLVEAYAKGKLFAFQNSLLLQGEYIILDQKVFRRMAEAAFERSRLDPLALFPSQDDSLGTLSISYNIHVGRFNDEATLWSLASLLSKPHVVESLSQVHLAFHTDRQPGDWKLYKTNPSRGWTRAFVKLWDASVEPEAVNLMLARRKSKVAVTGPIPEASLGPPPTFSLPFSQSHLRKLYLTGLVLNLVWPSHVNGLLCQSSSTLTGLFLDGCELQDSTWKTLLSKCHLLVLEEIQLDSTNIPLNVLTPFLLLNPSMTCLTIRTPSKFAYRQDSRLDMRREDRPRFLPRLRELSATTDFLLALFNPASGTEPDIPLFNLESLTIMDLRDTPTSIKVAENYANVTRVLSRIGRSTKTGKHNFIALRDLTLKLQYSSGETELWLESASSRDVGDGTIYSIKSVLRAAAALVTYSASPLPDLAQALSTLDKISNFHLIVEKNNSRTRRTYAIHPYNICAFVGALPRVKEVTLEGVFNCPRHVVANAEEFWGGVRRMWDDCSALERLEMRGIGGSPRPAVWIREHDEPVPGFAAWAPPAPFFLS